VYLSAITSSAWRSLAAVVGEPGLADAPELATAEQRFGERDRVNALIGSWTQRQTVEEAVRALARARVPCGVYRTTREVPGDAQVRAEEMLDYVDLEVAGLERVPVSVTPIRFSELPQTAPSRPPRVGEHNDEVYASLLGYDGDRLARLRRDGVL
jgi:formyl-CoA transferase